LVLAGALGSIGVVEVGHFNGFKPPLGSVAATNEPGTSHDLFAKVEVVKVSGAIDGRLFSLNGSGIEQGGVQSIKWMLEKYGATSANRRVFDRGSFELFEHFPRLKLIGMEEGKGQMKVFDDSVRFSHVRNLNLDHRGRWLSVGSGRVLRGEGNPSQYELGAVRGEEVSAHMRQSALRGDPQREREQRDKRPIMPVENADSAKRRASAEEDETVVMLVGMVLVIFAYAVLKPFGTHRHREHNGHKCDEQ
jgi:hypothetical protein